MGSGRGFVRLTAAAVCHVSRSLPAVAATVPCGSLANATASSGCSHVAKPSASSFATTAATPAGGSVRWIVGFAQSGILLGMAAQVLEAAAQSRTTLHQICSSRHKFKGGGEVTRVFLGELS